MSGTLLCRDSVFSEEPCPSEFGLVVVPSSLDDLMVGLEIGGAYSGRVELEWSSDGTPAELIGASCELAGKDCLFSTDLLNRPGFLCVANGVLDVSDPPGVAPLPTSAPILLTSLLRLAWLRRRAS